MGQDSGVGLVPLHLHARSPVGVGSVGTMVVPADGSFWH